MHRVNALGVVVHGCTGALVQGGTKMGSGAGVGAHRGVGVWAHRSTAALGHRCIWAQHPGTPEHGCTGASTLRCVTHLGFGGINAQVCDTQVYWCAFDLPARSGCL